MSNEGFDDTAIAAEVVTVAPQLHRAIERRAAADFAAPKPPEVQLGVLRLVREQPGITIRELAAALQLKPGNASALVTTMATAGMLRKEQHPADRRVVRVHLTEAELGRIEQVDALFTGYVEAALTELTTAQRAAIRDALPALAELARRVRDA